jgi:hydroxymethylglutaryl-CoA synthase
MVSFGSGAGSDGFIFEATYELPKVQDLAPKTRDMLNGKKIYLDYGKYAAYRRKILFND